MTLRELLKANGGDPAKCATLAAGFRGLLAAAYPTGTTPQQRYQLRCMFYAGAQWFKWLLEEVGELEDDPRPQSPNPAGIVDAVEKDMREFDEQMRLVGLGNVPDDRLSVDAEGRPL